MKIGFILSIILLPGVLMASASCPNKDEFAQSLKQEDVALAENIDKNNKLSVSQKKQEKDKLSSFMSKEKTTCLSFLGGNEDTSKGYIRKWVLNLIQDEIKHRGLDNPSGAFVTKEQKKKRDDVEKDLLRCFCEARMTSLGVKRE